MKVGIGHGNESDGYTLGVTVAKNAIEKGSIEHPDIVFAFCSGTVDHESFLKGITSVVGDDAAVVGGSTVGVLTNDYLSYEEFPAAAAVLQTEDIQFRIAVEGDLNKGETVPGRKLTERLSSGNDNKLFVFFYDSIHTPATEMTPPILNSSAPLLEGMKENLDPSLMIIGAGIIGDHEFSSPKLFCGSHIDTQSVVGIMFGGAFTPYYRISHGCTPLNGSYHTITRAKDAEIYEVDGEPIVEMIDNIYENKNWRYQHPVQLLTIGVNYGERFGRPEEANFVNRLITGALPDGKGISLFEPDIKEGTEIQFMLRDTNKMIESAHTNAVELFEQIEADGRVTRFGLYIDCAGRTASYSHTMTEESLEVQKVFNHYHIPLLGFFSGVEVAPLLGESRGLDWTGVIVVFTEDMKHD